MDWTVFWIIVIAVVAVVALVAIIAMIVSYKKKKASQPSHIELYFDDNFRNIMSEWDMVTRDKVKDFRSDITKRLKTVGSDIDLLHTKKKGLEKRMNALDKQITKLEGL